MNRCLAALCFVCATLTGACTVDHALALSNDGGANQVDGAAGVATTSCSTCSVGCSGIANYDALHAMATDGQSVFMVSASGDTESLVRLADDDSVSTLAANRRNVSYYVAVGQNTLAWWEDPSPDPTAVSTVYALPSNTAGTPLPLATINPGSVVVDAANLYYVGAGTTTMSSIPLVGGAVTSIATAPSGDLTHLIYVDSGAVYYYDGTNNVTSRQPKDGSAATNLAGAAGFGGVSDGVNFYNAFPNLAAVPLDGGPVRTLVTWTGSVRYAAPQQLATDGVRVYYIDPVCNDLNMGCAIRSVPVGGGAVTTLCSSVNAPIYIAATASGVYVVDGSTLIKLAKN